MHVISDGGYLDWLCMIAGYSCNSVITEYEFSVWIANVRKVIECVSLAFFSRDGPLRMIYSFCILSNFAWFCSNVDYPPPPWDLANLKVMYPGNSSWSSRLLDFRTAIWTSSVMDTDSRSGLSYSFCKRTFSAQCIGTKGAVVQVIIGQAMVFIGASFMYHMISTTKSEKQSRWVSGDLILWVGTMSDSAL